jgi:hypothetical protein
MTKPAARTAEGHGPDRACRNKYPHSRTTESDNAFSRRNPLDPNSRISGAANSG